MSANVGNMFYYGDTPWHGEGMKLDHPANIDEALLYGGLDWEVGLFPIFTSNAFQIPIRMRKAVIRTDLDPSDYRSVLGVVHNNFKPLQNREGALIFDSLFADGEHVYHTGGYLGNGEVVWLLAKLPKNICLRGDDIVEPYILYSNSHNGTRSIDLRITTIRVVCQNTLTVALAKSNEPIIRYSHKGSYASLREKAADFFQFSYKMVDLLQSRFEKLGRVTCSNEAFHELITRLIPDPNCPKVRTLAMDRLFEAQLFKSQSIRNDLTESWKRSLDTELVHVRGTWWAALNTITDYFDHKAQTTIDRYSFMMFGTGDSIKQKAYASILQEIQ